MMNRIATRQLRATVARSVSRSTRIPLNVRQWKPAFQNVRFMSDTPPPPPKNPSAEAATKEGESSPADETEVPAGEEEEEAAAAEEPAAAAPEQPALTREEELEAEVKDLKNQLLRSLAEQDNTRRIAKKDVESARQFAIKSFAKALLESSDNLERALQAVPVNLRKDQEKHAVLATLYEGIEMTETGLNKAFELNGLVKFGAVGDKFDPNQHEALFNYADPEKETGTVGQLMKAGFMLNERVLRPAEVGVVKNA